MIKLIWLAALALYVVFRAWYDNWSRPLSREEVDFYIDRLARSPAAKTTDLAAMRRFLEQDDGKEAIMLNLVKMKEGPQPHPVTGAQTAPSDLLNSYLRDFRKVLFSKGGHPLMILRKCGGYVDSWGSGDDPGWQVAGMMRYRSRRDMIELATDSRFNDAYPFKIMAVEATVSFPTSPVLSLALIPRVSVGLVLALLAALAHLLMLR